MKEQQIFFGTSVFPWPGYYEIALRVCLTGERITK